MTGLDGQDRDFYLRQLRDWKASVDVEVILPKGMAVYARMCGWTLARAHARSGSIRPPLVVASLPGWPIFVPAPLRTKGTTR